MSKQILKVNCLFCETPIPDNKIETKRIVTEIIHHEFILGKGCVKTKIKRKQTVHNTDHCTLLNLGLKDEQVKKQNCYRRHQDFKKRLQTALDSNDVELQRFARKCLWQMLTRSGTKYLNKQLTSIRPPPDDTFVFTKFRVFQKSTKKIAMVITV